MKPKQTGHLIMILSTSTTVEGVEGYMCVSRESWLLGGKSWPKKVGCMNHCFLALQRSKSKICLKVAYVYSQYVVN